LVSIRKKTNKVTLTKSANRSLFSHIFTTHINNILKNHKIKLTPMRIAGLQA